MSNKRNLIIILSAILFATGFFCPAEALAQQPPDIGDTVEQAYLAHRRGDYDEAIQIITSIIQRRGLTVKERAVSYLLRGEAKRDKGDLDGAIMDFTRALNMWSNYPQAIFFRGQVLVQLNELEKAYADLSRAVELDPERESYRTNLALLKKRMEAEGLSFDVPMNSLDITPPEE